MRLLFLIIRILVPIVFIEYSTQGFEFVTYPKVINIEEEDIGPVPTTEQIMDPKIRLGNSVDNEDEEEAESWDKNLAVRDVAYFLRAHKFQDFDRRYYQNISNVPKRLYEEFPKPTLKALHWEVHQECDVGFAHCLKYLHRITKLAALKREDDTVTIMMQNNWSLTNNTQQISVVQSECKAAKKRDAMTVVPFEGPIGRVTQNSIFFLVHAQKWTLFLPETREENPLFGVHTKNVGVINNIYIWGEQLRDLR